MVQKRRGTERRPTSPPPMTPNEVLRLDNVVKNLAPPEELKKLKSPYSFTVPAASGTPKLEDLSHKVKMPNGMSAWRLDGSHKIIRGLPIREFIQQKGGSHVDSLTLPLPPPMRPDWADQIYHPKVLPRTSRSKMRRRSGSLRARTGSSSTATTGRHFFDRDTRGNASVGWTYIRIRTASCRLRGGQATGGSQHRADRITCSAVGRQSGNGLFHACFF